MNKKLSVLLVAVSLTLTACDQAKTNQSLNIKAQENNGLSQINQVGIDKLAQQLDVSYKLVSNIPTKQCDATKSEGNCFTSELSLTSPEAMNTNGWAVYFSHISPIQSSDSEEFFISHINGDLHKITLKTTFRGFNEGETKKITFRTNFWMLSETDALPNYIVTNDQNSEPLEARVIESTKTAIDADSGLEYLPFVVPFTDINKHFKRTATDKTQWLNSETLYQRNIAVTSDTNAGQNVSHNVDQSIIPTPKSVIFDKHNGVLSVAKGLNFSVSNVNEIDIFTAIQRLQKLGLSQSINGVPVSLSVIANDAKTISSYSLSITDKGIKIEGVDGNGVFNGLQTLASLHTVGKKSLPLLTITDEPHYAFRGLLLDVARNFHSKDVVLKLIEQMGAYKLNKLHLHLGDDEGWRLEIPSLPELTEVGSKRCFDSQEQSCLIPQLGAGVDESTTVNGYYSVSDYQEILRAASANHIQVIPSLDMPGHSRSSIKAMQARYNKYKALEDDEKATEFLLHDFDDKTVYSSVQYYNDNTINVCMESSYAFVKEVMTQVKEIHQKGGQPLTRYHIGADETAGAWVESPVCKAFVENNDYGITDISQVGPYFIERVASILSDLDIETAGWSDGMSHTNVKNMPAIVQANAWDLLFWGGHSKVHELANRNWQVVLSTPDVLYFDFPYEADPKEHGYYWASRHINTEKIFQFIPDNLPIHAEFWLDREDQPYTANDTLQVDESGNVISAPLAKNQQFLGIQGQLWSENTRTDEMVEHKIFPRLLALAERAWYLPEWAVPYNFEGAQYSRSTNVFTDKHQEKRDLAWQKFAATLGSKEFAKLELGDIEYRLPTVGATIKNNTLFANIAFPGLNIEYQVNNGEWQIYRQPIKVDGTVNVRSRNLNGDRTSRITAVQPEKK